MEFELVDFETKSTRDFRPPVDEFTVKFSFDRESVHDIIAVVGHDGLADIIGKEVIGILEKTRGVW